MKKKQGTITHEDLIVDRERAKKLVEQCKRDERYIRINDKHTIGVPSHLTDEEVQYRVERYIKRMGLSKVKVA